MNKIIDIDELFVQKIRRENPERMEKFYPLVKELAMLIEQIGADNGLISITIDKNGVKSMNYNKRKFKKFRKRIDKYI